MLINDIANNQNLDIQVFIIKQIQRNKKAEFEKRYANFLGKQKSFFNVSKDFSNLTKPLMFSEQRLTSFLVPLIYDTKNWSNIDLEEQKFDLKDDLNAIDQNGKLNKIEKVFWNKAYNSIKKCPLLDFTKLAYIFQTNLNNTLGISSVMNFNVQLTVNAPSSATITLENFDYKYNFTQYENLENQNDIYKSVFDTDDIVILRVEKRSDRDWQNDKYTDLYADGKDDALQTVFAGFINNVNENIDWNSRTQSVSLVCQGPSKLITYVRLITGQATADMDVQTAIVPISCYSIPQSTKPNGDYALDNTNIIKNIITRTLTSMDNIESCYKAKQNFNENFKKLYNNQLNDNKEVGQQVQNYRTEYNKAVSDNFEKFIVSHEEAGYFEIYKNIYKTKETDKYLPIFRLMGTDQPATQYAFNTFKQMFVANWETVYQFIKKIADNLQFNFYDDPYGVIHFEIIDTDISHLYNSNDPNYLTQVVSYQKTQDTNAIANVMPIYAEAIWANALNGQNLGIGAIVRDSSLISQYGERPMTPRNITGLTETKACERYGRELLSRMNRRINSYTLSLIGNPELKLAKYAYFKEYSKLFYIEQISHQYNAGSSLTSSIVCTYERPILSDVINAVDNPFSEFNLGDDKRIDKEFLSADNKIDKQRKFNYLRGLLNKKLETIKADNYVEKIKQLFANVNQDNVSNKLIAELKNKFGYDISTESSIKYWDKLYRAEDYKNAPVVPFLFLDGYFWVHNFDSDMYKLANSLQLIKQEEIEKAIETDRKAFLEKQKKQGN